MRIVRSDAFSGHEDSSYSGERESRSFSVDEVTQMIKGVLEPNFRSISVVGEISNQKVQPSNHCYFTLKDEKAQLPSVMWKSDYIRLPFKLKDGLKVLCHGRIELYAPYGKCQLVVTKMEPVGVGTWELRLRELQDKFQREGLFDPARKKPLPFFIKRVGVATSPTGAALRDFVNKLASFSKGIEVVVAPTKVQGAGASSEIGAAIRALNDVAPKLGLDAIALIRGGGSFEDLWEFNEEATVRAIAASRLPVITGVGHEIDVSLCDLVADVRALTPTAAADCIVMRDNERLEPLKDKEKHMLHILESRLEASAERLRSISSRRVFQEPAQVIWERKTNLLDEATRRLSTAVDAAYKSHDSRWREAVARLSAMSPLAVLSRGYSITKDVRTNAILRKASEVKKGDVVETRFSEGYIRCITLETYP